MDRNDAIEIAKKYSDIIHQLLSKTRKSEALRAKLKWYEEQFRLSQQKRFGRSSEQTNSEQLMLFNEAIAKSSPPEPPLDNV